MREFPQKLSLGTASFCGFHFAQVKFGSFQSSDPSLLPTTLYLICCCSPILPSVAPAQVSSLFLKPEDRLLPGGLCTCSSSAWLLFLQIRLTPYLLQLFAQMFLLPDQPFKNHALSPTDSLSSLLAFFSLHHALSLSNILCTSLVSLSTPTSQQGQGFMLCSLL